MSTKTNSADFELTARVGRRSLLIVFAVVIGILTGYLYVCGGR